MCSVVSLLNKHSSMSPPSDNIPRIVFSASTVDNKLSNDNEQRNSFSTDDDAYSDLELMSTSSILNQANSNTNKKSIRRSSTTHHRRSSDQNYKRLSIFTNNHESIEDKVANKLKRPELTNKASNNTQKSLKIVIPSTSSNVSSSDKSPHSPMLKTPISFQKRDQDQLGDDFNSVLDAALFKSAWMPAKDKDFSSSNKNQLTPKNLAANSSSSNVSTLSTNTLRHRKKKSILQGSPSMSFNHDLENNESIPLNNLNFDIPTIQVDNYMDNMSPPSHHHQVPYSSTSHIDLDNNDSFVSINNQNNNVSNLDIEGDSSSPTPLLVPQAQPLQSPENTNSSSNVSKVFAKISKLVNSDTIELKPRMSNSSADDVSFLSSEHTTPNTDTDRSKPHEVMADDTINNTRLDDNIDVESIYTYYLNEIDNNRNQPNNDEIYPLDPFSNKLHNANVHTNVSSQVSSSQSDINNPNLNIETTTDTLPLFGKSLKQFGAGSSVRRACYLLLTYPAMNQVFTLMLIIQVGILSYQQWKHENGYVYNGGYTWADWILFVFYFIYTMEMFAKIIAFGLYDDSQMINILKLERYENELKKFYSKLSKSFKDSTYLSKPFQKIRSKLKNKKGDYSSSNNSSFISLNASAKNTPLHINTQQVDSSSDNENTSNEIPEDNNQPSLRDKYGDHPIHYAYMRTEWNRIDFVSIICFWVSFFLSLKGTDIGKYQVFRSLMCLRILRLLNITKGSRVILRGLKDAAIQSKQVFMLLFCFWVLLSIIGVESFKSSFKRHCVWFNPNNVTDTYSDDFQFCGSYLDSSGTTLPYVNELRDSSDIIKGYTCPKNSICIMTENPYNNRLSFDNIAQSLQSVFVIMSANTFTDLMYYTMDSDSMVSSLFFIISIFILAVWMVNLVVAVIIHSYKREEKSRKTHLSLHRKYQDLYVKFIKKSKIFSISKRLDFFFVLIILISFIYGCTKKRIGGVLSKKYNTYEFATCIIMMIEILGRFGLFVYAGNWRVFFYSIFNWVDLFSSVFALLVSLPPVFESLDTTVYGWLSIFGIIRFYRVVIFIKPIRNSWELALKKTKPFVELILFGGMLLYFVSIIMSRLFEGVVPVDEMEDNQWIMYNLPNCIVSLFIIMTTENWTGVLYTAEEYAQNTFTAFCIAMYLLSWFAISNTVILSIFIAIITDNLELPEAEKRVNQIKEFVKSCVAKVKNNEHEGLVDLIKNNFDRNVVSDEANTFITRMNELLVANGQAPIDVETFDDDKHVFRPWFRNIKKYIITEFNANRFYTKSAAYRVLVLLRLVQHKLYVLLSNNIAKNQNRYSYDETKFSTQLKIRLANKLRDLETDVSSTDIADPFSDYNSGLRKPKREESIDRSLLIFTNYNPIRRFCQMLVSPPNLQRTEGRQPAPKLMYAFTVLMFLASVVVVILACYETPLYRKSISPNASYNIWTSYADVVFMVIFSIEFFVKLIADGCLFGPRAYFKSFWNFLDFLVLVSFWVTVLSILNNNYSLVVTFGALKAFRAFRLLTLTKESQLVFQFAIISGAYKILSAALVSLSLLIPFALWGLNIFSDELSYCADGVSSRGDCSLEFYNEVFKWEILSPNYVETPYLYFDNFAASFQSLFEILSLEGWTDLLTYVMNITSYGEQPGIFTSAGNGLFVIIFIFVSTVFIINLFISIIINNYSLQTGVAFLNDEQYGWYEVKKVLSMVKPSKRRDDGELSQLQKNIFKFVSNKNSFWSHLIKVTLLVHFVLLLSESYPYSLTGDDARYGLFVVTTGVLLVHMILLQFSLGARVFYSNKWNLVMMFVIITALALTCLSFGVSDKTVFTNINKAFLVAVLCMIIPQVDMLNQLIKYGSTGLFSLISLLYTWLVLFLVFAIALNQLFGLTRLGENTTGNLNARTVTKALIMLFRNSFGEGWNQIMIDFEVEEPYCYNNGYSDSDCGSKTLALVLFICWNIVSMYIFLNILISVVITNFSYIYHGSGPHKLITREEIRKFKSAWNKFDVNGSGFIYESDLFKFLHSLDGVLSYHVYPKYFSLPAITEKTVVFKNPNNGYDIEFNITKMEEILSFIDFRKVRRRRMRYERLVSELLASSIELTFDTIDENENNTIRKIPFKESLLVIGYYSRFEDSTCLNLEDFLRHSTQIKNINRELRKAKVVSTIKMIFTRLRYKFAVDKMKIFDKIANASPLEKEMLKEELRNSLKGADLSYEVLTDTSFRVIDPENPIFNNNLYRVMSTSSRNPFSDAYIANQSFESLVSEEDVLR